MADVTIDEAAKEEWDLIALPGGVPGANHLRDCPTLIEMLKKQKEEKKLLAAVCAAPGEWINNSFTNHQFLSIIFVNFK